MLRFLAPLVRGLLKQPGFSGLAVLTLALGIGINVAIFSALEALVIHALPFPHADRLGIYAILAFTVELRRREIGVRLALGAGRGDVIRLVALDGMRLAATGALLGTMSAAALARVLYSSLYGVRPFDPITWATVCGVLALVSLVACVVPARRAAATSPSIALRAD